jgi:hypothetical protein
MTTAMTEADLTALLVQRYSFQAGNGQRYVTAAQVRSHAGFDAKRTADFIAMDLWPSQGLPFHGHEIKVSRADWLRELKDPAKADEFTPYMNFWWVAVPDAAIVRPGELTDGWGLLAVRDGRLAVARKAARRDALPMPPSRLAALLRAVAEHARNSRPPAGLTGSATAADLGRARAERNRFADRADRAEQAARTWRQAYGVRGHLPCAYCTRPVTCKLSSGYLGGWRHVNAAHEPPCAEIRQARGRRWADPEPAEDISHPQMEAS